MALPRLSVPAFPLADGLDPKAHGFQARQCLPALVEIDPDVPEEVGRFGQASVGEGLPDTAECLAEEVARPSRHHLDIEVEAEGVGQGEAASIRQSAQRRYYLRGVARFQG